MAPRGLAGSGPAIRRPGSGTRVPAPPRSSLGLESPAPPDPRCWAFLPGLVPSGLLMDGTAPESRLGDQGNDSLTREGHPQQHGGGYAADPSTPSTPRHQPGLFSSPRMKRSQPTGLPVWPIPTWAPAWTGVSGRGEASFGGVEPQGPPALRPTLSLVWSDHPGPSGGAPGPQQASKSLPKAVCHLCGCRARP